MCDVYKGTVWEYKLLKDFGRILDIFVFGESNVQNRKQCSVINYISLHLGEGCANFCYYMLNQGFSFWATLYRSWKSRLGFPLLFWNYTAPFRFFSHLKQSFSNWSLWNLTVHHYRNYYIYDRIVIRLFNWSLELNGLYIEYYCTHIFLNNIAIYS